MRARETFDVVGWLKYEAADTFSFRIGSSQAFDLRRQETSGGNHGTMKPATFVFVLVAALAFAKGPQRYSNLPITSTFASADASGANADIQSDGLGSYFDGVGGVTSSLTTNGYGGILWGDWQFGTLNSTTRLVSISFANPISVASGGTATPNAPFTIKNVTAHIEDKCT